MTDHSDKNNQDNDLFRKTVGSVNSIKNDRIKPHKRQPSTTSRQSNKDNLPVMEQFSEDFLSADFQPSDILSYHQPGVQPQTLKKLRLGALRIDSVCDLHGLTVNEARPVLSAFFHEAEIYQWRCLKIIHGKGKRSANHGPVLKGLVDAYLRQKARVLAFHSAIPRDGGTGAVYILLKKEK